MNGQLALKLQQHLMSATPLLSTTPPTRGARTPMLDEAVKQPLLQRRRRFKYHCFVTLSMLMWVTALVGVRGEAAVNVEWQYEAPESPTYVTSPSFSALFPPLERSCLANYTLAIILWLWWLQWLVAPSHLGQIRSKVQLWNIGTL
jgi:hypothetical protein